MCVEELRRAVQLGESQRLGGRGILAFEFGTIKEWSLCDTVAAS